MLSKHVVILSILEEKPLLTFMLLNMA